MTMEPNINKNASTDLQNEEDKKGGWQLVMQLIKSKKIKPYLLLLATIIWGGYFCVQKIATNIISDKNNTTEIVWLFIFAFNGLRALLGCLLVILMTPLFNLLKNQEDKNKEKNYRYKDLIHGGFWCGIVFGFASVFQQLGIKDTDSGIAGFITGFYIIFVAIYGHFFQNKRCSTFIVFSVVLAIFGLFLFWLSEGLKIDNIVKGGVIWLLLCAICFAIHIIFIDEYTSKCDYVRLSYYQFFVGAIVCFCVMFLIICIIFFIKGMTPMSQIIVLFPLIKEAKLPIAYAGIGAAGFGTTFQICGQKDYDETRAAVIMSLESTFAAIGGWMFLKEKPTAWKLLGFIVMFSAIMLAQRPMKMKEM